MPHYTYVALDSRGQESTGLVDAPSTNEAIGQLRQAGYFPTKVCEEGTAVAGPGKAARRAPKKPGVEQAAGANKSSSSSESRLSQKR